MFAALLPTVSYAAGVPEWQDGAANGAKGTMELDTTVKYAGKASMKITHDSGYKPNVYRRIFTKVPVKGGKFYKVKMMAKAESAKMVTLAFEYGSRTSLLPFGGTYDWRDFEVTYKHTGGDASIEFQILFDDKAKGFWLDNVEMYELDGSGEPTGENLIKNGDFESGDISGGSSINLDNVTPQKNVIDSAAGYYPLYRAKNITIDANDDDWADYPLMNIPTDPSQIFVIVNGAEINSKMKFKAAYDDQYIYQWVDVEDDKHIYINNAGTYWQGDSLQVALSDFEDGYGKEFGIIHDEEENKGYVFNTSEEYKVKTKRGDGHTIYEIALPWSCYFSGGVPDKFKYCIIANENDGDGRTGVIQLSPGVAEGKLNDKFPIFEVMKTDTDWRPWLNIKSFDETTGKVDYRLNVMNNGEAKTVEYKSEVASGSINVPAYSTVSIDLPMTYDTPGKKTMTAEVTYGSETVPTDTSVTLKPTYNYTELLRDDLRAKTKELEGLLVKCAAKGISTDYENMRYRIISSFIDFFEEDEIKNDYQYILNYHDKCTKLYEKAKTRLENYLSGKEVPKEVPKYVTSDLETDGTLIYANTELNGKTERQPVFFIGYGHFERARNMIPIFNEYGVNTLQNEIGPWDIIKDNRYWSGYNANGAANASFEYSQEDAHSGEWSYKFVFNDNVTANRYVTIEQTMDVKPNTTYKFGVFAKGKNARGSTISLDDWGTRVKMPEGTYDWQEVSSIYTTGNTNKATFRFIIEDKTDALYLDDFYVIEDGAEENIIGNPGLENMGSDKYWYIDADGAKWVQDMLADAEVNNVAVNLLVSPHYFPRFMFERFPETQGKRAFVNIKSELGRQVIRDYLNTLIPLIKDYKSLKAICLTNEPGECVANYGEEYRPYYTEFLKEKYGALENVSRAHGKQYKDFSEVPFEEFKDSASTETPEYRDFWEFNNREFAEYHKFLADTIKAIAPDIPLNIKVMWYLSSIDDVNEQNRWKYGINHKWFSEAQDWNGNDCSLWITEVQSGIKAPMSKSFFYDYQVGVKNAPVVNAEDHFIEDGSQNFSDDQYFHTASDMWMSCFHGRTMTQLWLWDRSYEGHFKNSILFRPDCVEAVSTASFDINRLAKEAAAVINAKSDFAVLYSDTARVYSRDHLNTAFKAYESLYYTGNKAHVLPEERLNEAYNYKALVIPNVRNISRENLNIILDYMAKGGKVLLMGNDNILKDENNQDIEKELSDKVYAAAESLATVSEGVLVKSPSNIEIRDFFHDYAKKLGGSRIGLIDPDTGKRLDNTEFEYGVYGDDIIINCCNYEYRAPKKFKVYIDGAEQKCKITELRSMKECENSTVELPSVLPIMIKIEGAAKLIK